MNVVIVEDDDNKASQLAEFIRARLPVARTSVAVARSYQSGLRMIVDTGPDLILLDMSMPTYDVSATEPGGRPKAFAGRDILRELKRRKLKSRAIVVTQFERFGEGDETTTLEELKLSLEAANIDNYLGTVYYHPAQSNWRDELQRLLAGVGGA